MSLERATRQTLKYLFSEYQKGPAVMYPINDIAKKHHIDAVELSDYMMEKGWIKERWVYPGNKVSCKITIQGIEEIAPAYVRERLRNMIGGLGESGGSKALIEILEQKLQEYSIAMDMVRQLEQLGLIEVRHPDDTIVVELTDEGRKYYERGSKTFFTLMAY